MEHALTGYHLILKIEIFFNQINCRSNLQYRKNDSRAPTHAPYSLYMVNLFSFGCHVIDRAYVRTRLQIVRVR